MIHKSRFHSRLTQVAKCFPMDRGAEIASGIICGCLPVLPALFRHHRFWRSIKTLIGIGQSSQSSDRTNVKDRRSKEQHVSLAHRGPYLELSDWAHSNTVAMAIETGAHVATFENDDSWEDRILGKDNHVESTQLENTIRKTVRMEATVPES